MSGHATKSTAAKNAAPADEAVDSAALDSAAYKGSPSAKTGLYQLEKSDLFNLLCILPSARDGDVPDDVYQEAMSYCAKRRAILIVDPKIGWASVSAAQSGVGSNESYRRHSAQRRDLFSRASSKPTRSSAVRSTPLYLAA